MDILKLRNSYESIMNHLLFFSNAEVEECRKKYEIWFLETWDRIPQADHARIRNNLEFILCKEVNDLQAITIPDGIPACTFYYKINCRCYVVYNPFTDSLKHDTKIHVLAHEFAHVFYNHPRIGFELDNHKKEEEYIREKAEPDAYALTCEKWNILPDPEDIHKLPDYREYVLNKK